jgi:hypothetical protein
MENNNGLLLKKDFYFDNSIFLISGVERVVINSDTDTLEMKTIIHATKFLFTKEFSTTIVHCVHSKTLAGIASEYDNFDLAQAKLIFSGEKESLLKQLQDQYASDKFKNTITGDH